LYISVDKEIHSISGDETMQAFALQTIKNDLHKVVIEKVLLK
jgi:hypothetical protein